MNTSRLPNASYKGFDQLFYVDDSINDTNKVALHEYPNRDGGYVEELGWAIKQITVKFRVFNTLNNDTVDEWERVLATSGGGTLILPLQGSFENMVIVSKIKNATTENLGYIEYTLNFAQTTPSQYPTSTNSNTSFLDRLKNKILGDNVDAFEKAWNSLKNKKTQTEKALSKVRATGNAMVDIAKRVEGTGSLISDFANTISVLTSSAVRLVNSPRELATQIQIGFDSLEQNIENTQILFNVFSSYFGYNVGDNNTIGVGQIQTQIQKNQEAINNVIRSNALAESYVFSTLLEYNTVNELNDVRQKMQNEYDDLFEKLPDDIAITLEELQVNTNRLLDRQVLTLPRLEVINVNPQPLAFLVYSLYGSLDNYDTIYNINNVKDARQVSGAITIIS